MTRAADWGYRPRPAQGTAWGGRDEAVRVLLVRLVFAIYWLLILEGALRKWIFPQLQEVFFFIRIPVTLGLYLVAFGYRHWPRTVWPLLLTYLFSALAIVLVPIQILAGGYDSRYLFLASYGWINYFFYIPLAFVIAEQFRQQDLHRLIRHTLWFAFPATFLVIIQFNAPTTAIVNSGSGVDEFDQFRNLGAVLGFVRPTGFFTSVLGQSNFIASAMALVLAASFGPRAQRKVSNFLLIAGTVAFLVMAVLGQSRGLFIQLGIIAIGSIVSGLITNRVRMITKSILFPVVGLCIGALLWLFLFPTALEVFVTRWTESLVLEREYFIYGVLGRAFHSFYAFLEYITKTPWIGYLMGFGGNASLRLDWVVLPAFAYEWTGFGIWGLESGWAVHLIELGLLAGLAFIAFRVCLTLWVGWNACRITYLSGNPMPILLFGYVGIIVLIGQITEHGTVNGYAWIFLGLCMASIRIFGRKHCSGVSRNEV